ncbi:uncharacterized protein ACO6RY_11681 [Pungitius sinensis]
MEIIPWLTKLRDEVSNHPLLSNVIVGLILVGLEELMEVEFECPCNSTWNGVFSSTFFIIPAAMAFAFMLIIQKGTLEWSKKTVSCFVPAIVWLILLFFDGQYFACAMTTWKGRFVAVDKDDQMKWCKPNVTSEQSMGDLWAITQKFYAFSQGTSGVLLICVFLILCVINARCDQGVQAGENMAVQSPEAVALQSSEAMAV